MTATCRDVSLASASGILLALAFPSANLSLCAWVGLVPLLWALMNRPALQAFGLGWVCGFVFAIGALYWVVNPIRHYTDAPIFVAGLALILLAAVLGLYTAAFAGGLRTAIRAGIAPEIAGPPLWVALEWLRSSGPLAFPWVAFGYSQHHHHGLIQVVELTGVYGLSALLVFSNMVVYSVLRGGRAAIARRGVAIAILGVLAVGLPVVGRLRLEAMARASRVGRLAVGTVQANIDQGRKWDPAFQQATLDRHAELTAAASRKGATLVVWAETAAPFYFQSEGPQRERLLDLAVTNEVDVLFGSPAFAFDEGRLRFFNRANLVRRDGAVGGFYDKLRLVPFGEYVPFQSVFFFVNKMVEGVGDFAPGREATIFQLPEGRFGVLICYEGIFPTLSRQLVSRGADFLVNITNDAWFGDTSAPHQHLAMVTLRAIENRVPIVRVANTGISAVVDIDGRIRWHTGLFETAVRMDTLEWPHVDTVYTRYGDVFAGLCGLASAVLIGYAEWHRRRPARSRQSRAHTASSPGEV
jgi:apolipoprotein N-acyltransferase